MPLVSKTGWLACRLHALEVTNADLKREVKSLQRKLKVERALRQISEGKRTRGIARPKAQSEAV